LSDTKRPKMFRLIVVCVILLACNVQAAGKAAPSGKKWVKRKVKSRPELDKIMKKHKLTFVIAHPPEGARCPSCSIFVDVFKKLFSEGSRPNQAVWFQTSLYQLLTQRDDFPHVVDDDAHVCLFNEDKFVKKFQGQHTTLETIRAFVDEGMEKYGVSLKPKAKKKSNKNRRGRRADDDISREQEWERRRTEARRHHMHERHPKMQALLKEIKATDDAEKLRSLHKRLGELMEELDYSRDSFDDLGRDFHDLTEELFPAETLQMRLKDLQAEMRNADDPKERRRLKNMLRVVRKQLVLAEAERKRQGGNRPEGKKRDIVSDLKMLESLEARLGHKDEMSHKERKKMSAEIAGIRERMHKELNKIHTEV